MLEVQQLTKVFGGITAVQNVTARFERGRITAVIGPNGAGKSTFFNLVSGALKPTSGRVLFGGSDVTGLRPDQMATLGVARTFQTTHLFDRATVLDNLIIGHKLRTSFGLWDVLVNTRRLRDVERACRDKAIEALEFVGLANQVEALAGALSQEQRKRVAIALALATQPKLLLLDEPAGGINDEETANLGQLITRIAASGVTIGLIEHKMGMIMKLAQQVIVLDHGVVIAAEEPGVVQRDPQVIEAYLGADHVAT